MADLNRICRPIRVGIHKVANQADVNVQTIRFYERKGLVLPASRNSSGYRQYTEDALRRIRFIKHAQEIGFSLREVANLLSLQVVPDSTCGDVKAQAEAKIRDVDDKIRKLQERKAALGRLVEKCDEEAPVSECPIIEALEEVEKTN